MKKNTVFTFVIIIMVLVISITMLGGCMARDNQAGPVDQSEQIDQSDQEQLDEADLNDEMDQVEEDSLLTDEEAWELVQAWLDEHPDMATPYEPTTIAGLADEMYFYNGEEYYFFELNGYYWLDILLHPETGELLSVMTEDSDEPVEPVIEPLEDYYNRYY